MCCDCASTRSCEPASSTTTCYLPTYFLAGRVLLPTRPDRNKIGDEGARHLGDAIARGEAPALKELDLDNNPASDVAKQAVKDALKNRK